MVNKERDAGKGVCNPPTAGACVANQKDISMYEPMLGIRRGTVFPYLDLPWKNEINQGTLSDTVPNRLMAMDFALHECILYLDTHPDDEEMKSYAKHFKQQRDNLKKQYEVQYGPLMAADNPGRAWVKDPWPWQADFNERRPQNVGV